MSNLAQRLLLFFIGLPLLMAFIIFLPQLRHLGLALLIVVLAFIASAETAELFKAKGFDVSVSFFSLAGAVPPAAAWLACALSPASGGSRLWVLFLALCAETLVILAPLALSSAEKLPAALPLAAARIFTLFYPGLLAACLVLIASGLNRATEAFILFCLLTMGNDSLAWLFGMSFGKKRGIIAASPNKSIAGFIGGMTASIGISIAASYIISSAMGASFAEALILGILIGAASIMGDLFESALKRSAGVKDSGRFVPGRGGVLDSLDSLLFAAPLFYGLSRIMGLFR